MNWPVIGLTLLRVILIWWLAFCALQDLRTRHVANWLTVPPFLAALPLAYLLGGPERGLLCAVVAVCGYLVWRAGAMGAADAKMAGFLAAAQPAALVWGIAALWLMLAAERLRHGGSRRLSVPGAVGFCMGNLAVEADQFVRHLSFAFPASLS